MGGGDRPETREKVGGEGKTESLPPAGPHARDDLNDPEKTPGAGSLPDTEKGRDIDTDIGPD